eukprot:2593851-Pyramimonas_sp.AAC.1
MEARPHFGGPDRASAPLLRTFHRAWLGQFPHESRTIPGWCICEETAGDSHVLGTRTTMRTHVGYDQCFPAKARWGDQAHRSTLLLGSDLEQMQEAVRQEVGRVC